MKIDCERRVIMNLGCHFFADSEPGSVRERRRVEKIRHGKLQDCDGCGVVAPDVDLWAENSETGEQIWLCLTCGGL